MDNKCPNCGFTVTLSPRERRSLTARIKELEDFVVAEGECHISSAEFNRLESANKALSKACNLLLSGLSGDGYLTSCGAVTTEEAIELMAAADLPDPRTAISGNQPQLKTSNG